MMDTLATTFAQYAANVIPVIPMGISCANIGGGASLPHQEGGDAISDARIGHWGTNNTSMRGGR